MIITIIIIQSYHIKFICFSLYPNDGLLLFFFFFWFFNQMYQHFLSRTLDLWGSQIRIQDLISRWWHGSSLISVKPFSCWCCQQPCSSCSYPFLLLRLLSLRSHPISCFLLLSNRKFNFQQIHGWCLVWLINEFFRWKRGNNFLPVSISSQVFYQIKDFLWYFRRFSFTFFPEWVGKRRETMIEKILLHLVGLHCLSVYWLANPNERQCNRKKKQFAL